MMHGQTKIKINVSISLNSCQYEKCFRQRFLTKSKHTFYVQKLSFENHAIYMIMWKKCGSARQSTDDTIRRM